MATSIYFNGRLTHVPGSYSEVDASGLARVGLGATGIVACLGEAEGGAPYSEGLHEITNPGKVGRTFRDGDLLEAGLMLFDPSKDPDIPGGAQEVKFAKVNPATRSSITLNNGFGPSVEFTSVDWGAFTQQINLTIANGTNKGKAVSIVLGDDEEVLDDLGGDAIFTMEYIGEADQLDVALDPAVGLDGIFSEASAGLIVPDYTGTLVAPGMDGDQLASIAAGSTVDVASLDPADVGQNIIVYGIDNATGLPISESLVLNGTVAVVGAIAWDEVHGFIMDGVATGTVTLSQVGGGAPALYAAAGGAFESGIVNLANDAVECFGGPLMVSSDGVSTDDLIIIGLDSMSAPAMEVVTLNGPINVATITNWSEILAIGNGYVPAGENISYQGLLFNQGAPLSIVSTDPAQTDWVQVYGTDALGNGQVVGAPLNGVVPVSLAGTWNAVFAMSSGIIGGGVVLTRQSVGSLSQYVLTSMSFDSTLATSAGLHEFGAGIAVDNDTVDFTGTSVGRSFLIVGADTTGNPQMEVMQTTGAPLTTLSSWSAIYSLSYGLIENTSVQTMTGPAFSLSAATYDTLEKILAYFDTLTADYTLTEGVANITDYDLDDMDLVSGDAAGAGGVDFTADLTLFVEGVTAGSQIIAAAATPGAQGVPSNQGPVFLVGGSEGATGFSDWQAALDILRDYRVNTIVALTDNAAVHAAAVTHATYMAGPGRSERDCVLGAPSMETLDNLKLQSLALNTRHARYAFQDVNRYNTAGEAEQFPPYFTACLAAGMQAGSSVGTSLTWKFLNILSAVGDDNEYTIQDDADELIQRGLLGIEKVPNKGYRWLRNVTTYQIDDNIAYCEASVNEAANYATYEFRTAMETAVGKKGFAGTVNATLSTAIGILGQLVAAGAITQWQNLTISLEGDVMDVDVEIAPVIPVNFVKNTIHLVSASFAAAA
tara:strand:- start:1183 stop:3999 length:2817 start_codon:yes stop_codon:yes gene_type:complete